jgi:hypothetical protein
MTLLLRMAIFGFRLILLRQFEGFIDVYYCLRPCTFLLPTGKYLLEGIVVVMDGSWHGRYQLRHEIESTLILLCFGVLVLRDISLEGLLRLLMLDLQNLLYF